MMKKPGMQQKKSVVMVVFMMFLAILALVIVDYWVIYGLFNLGGESTERITVWRYWVAMSALVIIIGGGMTIAFWSGSLFQKQQVPTVMFGVFGSMIIILVSTVWDIMFFLYSGGLLPETVQWTWMMQYRLFGYWTTKEQLIWTTGWLALLPVLWFILFRVSSMKMRIKKM